METQRLCRLRLIFGEQWEGSSFDYVSNLGNFRKIIDRRASKSKRIPVDLYTKLPAVPFYFIHVS